MTGLLIVSRASKQKPSMPKIFKHSIHTNPHFTNYFQSLLQLCRKSQDLKALNSLLLVHGLIKNQPLIKQFVHQCCHLGFPNLALPAFKTIQKSSLYLQNLLIRSLSDNGSFQDLVCVYKKCQRNSYVLYDNYTYPFVIKACAALSDVYFGKMMHSVVLRTGYGENLVVQTSLLDFYSKVGEMNSACKLFDEIPRPDLIAWNALISGYSVNGFDYEVFRVLQGMNVMNVKLSASTLASLFPVCSRVGVTNIGVSLHGLAFKLGYSEEESLAPTLISMYANCGDLLAARNVFDASSKNSVAIWNAMISAYTRNHKPENAATLFQMMLLDDVKPNAVTFVSLLPSSENLGSISIVESFHAYVVKLGFEKQLSVSTALLSVYSKLGSIVSAEFLFRNIQLRNLLSWNSMISAYVGNGLWKQSFDAFCSMQIDGFEPDAISIISILSSCSELKATLLGKSAHAFSLKRGIDLNVNVSNAFLSFYCSCNDLSCSFKLFYRMVVKSVVSWNTMISGCVDNGESERAIFLFDQMRQKGLNFDLVTLISILPSCHDCQSLILGLAIHSYAIRTALINDISLGNALVSMYINHGELDSAKFLFYDMPHKSVVSWNAILTGYRYHNLQNETLELFSLMIEEGQKPNYVTMLSIVPSCHTFLQGKSIHGYVLRIMMPLETPLLTSLMMMYARFENLTSCLTLFRMGEKRSISLWNTIMSAHLLTKGGITVFSLFRELLWNKIEPDDVTFLNLVSACIQLKNLHISNSVLAYVIRMGFDKDITLTNALIDLYAKCGSVSSARTLFEDLPQKDIISWSVMINTYGVHGNGEEALTHYSQMRLLGLKPDRVTYMSILSACSHAGLVEQGLVVFESMKQGGISAGIEHYACMVDLLGRMGHLDEAYDIIKNLPRKYFVKLFESLLGACLSHGNYELGEEIGKLVLETNPNGSGPYVILYNIYAAAGKWIEANNVRLVMEQNQFCKPPGISLVDGNVIHEP